MFFYTRNVALIAGVLLGAGPLASSRAQACSIALDYFEFLSPMAGAVGVPTNATIFVQGPATMSADVIELVDVDGEVVPIEARQVTPLGLDIIPSVELLPEHGYTLWARWIGDTEQPPGVTPPSRDKSISFTTGPGPASVPAQLEAPELEVRVVQYELDSCGLQTGICVEASRPPDTTLEILLDGEVVRADTRDRWPRYSRPLAADDCIGVRVRDVRGNRSEASAACGERLQRISFQNNIPGTDHACDDYESYLARYAPAPADSTRDAEPVGWAASSGCALLPSGTSPARLGGFASILLALWFACRRRGARNI